MLPTAMCVTVYIRQMFTHSQQRLASQCCFSLELQIADTPNYILDHNTMLPEWACVSGLQMSITIFYPWEVKLTCHVHATMQSKLLRSMFAQVGAGHAMW